MDVLVLSFDMHADGLNTLTSIFGLNFTLVVLFRLGVIKGSFRVLLSREVLTWVGWCLWVVLREVLGW